MSLTDVGPPGFARTTDQIDHVVIAIPARDEGDTIARCVDSTLRSIASLRSQGSAGGGFAATLVVAADTCVDDTADVVARCAARHLAQGGSCHVHVVRGEWASAGAARAAAVERAVETAHNATSLRRIWIATTDADSYVPVDWLERQLRYADEGADAVAGIVELIDPSVDADRAFRRIYSLMPGREHVHVHGANLGVRGDAYFAAGGFPSIALSEDHVLWNELRRQRRRCVSPLDVVVHTSARPTGRAAGGFADTLAAAMLSDEEAV